jgi:precorrin-2/cobalt-factor-2 C20-methyltransferase
MSHKGKLYGVGIGPGDAELLTLKAIKALKKADVICLPKSKDQASTALEIVEEFLPKDIEQVQMVFSMSKDIEQRKTSRKNNALEVMEMLDKGKNVVFLTLGDPMLYSTYSYLLEYLTEEYSVENIPGIYSFSAISNTLSIPLCKGKEKVSVIGAFNKDSEAILALSDTTVCMKISSYGKQLAEFLKNNSGYSFTMISEAGKEEESQHFDAKVLEGDLPYFSTAIVQKIKQ